MASHQDLEKELIALFKKGGSIGLTDKQLRQSTVVPSKWTLSNLVLLSIIVAIGSVIWANKETLKTVKSLDGLKAAKIDAAEYFADWRDNFMTSPCLVDLPEPVMEACRPIANCSMCQGIESAPIRSRITRDEFLLNHAYTGRPVLVRNMTDDWTAFDTFSFAYFKKVFRKKRERRESDQEEDDTKGDSFFAYKTNFADLQHFLSMSKARERSLKWYVGWSNADKAIMEELRKHYNRPDFLPESSESSHVDWIFMGGSGPGAMIHIDAVSRPSWQAQIRGKKTWYLYPPPECEHVCKPFNITMHRGDIVVVDTNVWYHSTFIHPGEVSITIGSEYD